MAISVIALALAAQAAGQEVTTFHPLPAQQAEERQEAQEQAPAKAPAPEAAGPAKAAAAEAVEIKVLSVRDVPPDANVRFVPPPPPPPQP